MSICMSCFPLFCNITAWKSFWVKEKGNGYGVGMQPGILGTFPDYPN